MSVKEQNMVRPKASLDQIDAKLEIMLEKYNLQSAVSIFNQVNDNLE